MPQMAPLWWETLFIYFIMMFLLMNSIIYWNMNFKKSSPMNKNNKKNMNWKW